MGMRGLGALEGLGAPGFGGGGGEERERGFSGKPALQKSFDPDLETP